jgi:hypothetical protein
VGYLAAGADLGVVAIGNDLGLAYCLLGRGQHQACRQQQRQQNTHTSFHHSRALNAEVADRSGEMIVSHALTVGPTRA